MPLEIERKFLVRDDSYKQMAVSHSRIVQGYICSERGRTVRVRLKMTNPVTPAPAEAPSTDDKAYLTIKGPSGNDGLTRYEFEKEIAIDEALSLLRLCEPGTIDKVRWNVPLADGHICEVDEFHGANEGLTVAEIELHSEAEPYERPDFLGEEVTGDRRYYNSQLRRVPFTQW